MKVPRSFVTVTLFALLALPPLLAAQDTRYKLIDLGTFGGPSSYVGGVDNKSAYTRILNDRGKVAGTAETSTVYVDPNQCVSISGDCFVTHAFEWHDGTKTDLGVLPSYLNSGSTVISANGLIIGAAEDPNALDPLTGNPLGHAVLWKNGNITDLGALTEEGGYFSAAEAANSSGQVVGGAFTATPDPYSMLGQPFQTHAFLWQNGIMQDLGTLGGPDSEALMINEKGQVVGDSYINFNPTNACYLPLMTGAFIWEDGHMTDLGNLGGTCTNAIAQNNRGQITGSSNLAGDQAYHPYLWEGGSMKDLGTFGGSFGQGSRVNEAGDVVGWASIPGDQVFRAAVWTGGEITDVGALPGDANSFGFDINDAGQVLAVSTDSQFTSFRAFLWQKGRPMLDLEDLAARSGLQFGIAVISSSATNINNRGEIAGTAFDSNGNLHAVLLVPCGHVDTDCQEVRATEVKVHAANMPQNRAIADEFHRRLTSGGIPAMMRARMAHSRRNLLP